MTEEKGTKGERRKEREKIPCCHLMTILSLCGSNKHPSKSKVSNFKVTCWTYKQIGRFQILQLYTQIHVL